MSGIFRLKEKQEYEAWLKEKAAIKRLNPLTTESDEARKKRIADLLAHGHEPKFFAYYFSHLASSEFAYFQKRDVKHVVSHSDCFALMEWPREHAKSIIWDVMVPLLLKAKGELTGMLISSANEQKANKLLADIQAELMFNRRYIADFGDQYNQGKWQDGQFTTMDGVGFWAFGRGQSPRGVRESEKRPNYGVFDDIDDAVLVRNESRVREVVDWLLGDFYGAMPITGSRLIGVGNRIHQRSVLAHIAGDIEPDDPKREGLYHSKVFALENPKTHLKDIDGTPAWKERYTREQIMKKMSRMGWRIGLREYFHEHNVEGKIFREEDLPWVDCPPLSQYEKLCTYNDPSYKKTQFSDCKAIVLIGKTGRYFDIIDCFVRQCTTPEMVRAHYAIAAQVPTSQNCRHWMEAGFIQDLMLEEYWRYGEENGGMLHIRGDLRSKPDKEVRIENLTPFTEMGFIRFNRAMKDNANMKELRTQFIGFPDYQWDDGPDAVEGGIFKLNTGGKKGGKSQAARQGGYDHNKERTAF